MPSGICGSINAATPPPPAPGGGGRIFLGAGFASLGTQGLKFLM